MWVLFLFFKQKTAYEMRISDWSSDVCSSDLIADQRVRPVDGSVLRDRTCRDAFREEHRLVAALVVIERRAAAAQIRPRAIGTLARPGEDHRAHRIVGVALVERRDDLQHHLGGEGVHPDRKSTRLNSSH